MNKDDFRILKEICGLHSQLIELRSQIKAEESRIQKIEDLRKDARDSLLDLQTQHKEKSQILAQTESKIDQLQKKLLQSQDALDKAVNEKAALSSQKQLDVFREELAIEEETAFELMEEIDNFEEFKKDKETFLEGSSKSLSNIKVEVEENTDPLFKKIQITEERIKLLNQSLDQPTISRLDKLLVKKLKHGPLTRIENSACHICGYTVNATDRDQIEKSLLLKSCGSCTRIFIPNTTLY